MDAAAQAERENFCLLHHFILFRRLILPAHIAESDRLCEAF